MVAHVNGTALYYETTGAGRPLLVMHGGLGFDHTYLRPWLDRLGDHAEVVYYDHRGNGRSERPADWSAVTHATWADDADALREALGFERVVLFGHSYGSYLALEYAARYPHRLDGLILSKVAPVADFAGPMMAAVDARGLPEAAAALRAAFTGGPVESDEAMRQGVLAIAPLYTLDPELAPRLLAGMRFSAEAYNHAFGRCLPTYDVRAHLAAIDVPTLVLAGRHEMMPPPEQGAERLHAALPSSELVFFEHSAHFPFAEEPDAFTDAVAAWLDRLP